MANLIVTLDGPAGVGKTTLAKMIAERLGISYLDTGAMFRALAWQVGEVTEESEIKKRLAAMHFSLQGSGGESALFLQDRRLGQEIRSEEIGMRASVLAKYPFVREILKAAQQQIGKKSSLVVEGRDMGTEVFPEARFKFFLTASPEVRAKRRYEQLLQMGKPADLAELTKMIAARDEADRSRTLAPLRPAADARQIDTSDIDQNTVLQKILEVIEKNKQ